MVIWYLDCWEIVVAGKTVSKDDAPPGLKKPPWQIKTERLAEDQERERKEQNRAIKEGRPVQRPR